jgi:hypothetical protein
MFTIRRSSLARCLFWAALVISTVLLTHAQPPPKLVAQAEPQLHRSSENTADFEFGCLNLLDTPQMEHTFILRNEGIAPIIITQLSTTCHCTSVALEEVAGRKTSLSAEPVFTLPPGFDMKVKMTVQLVRQVAGRVTQGVYVYASGYNAPIACLRLACDLETGLRVAPAELDFGPIKAGGTYSRKITITYDERLVAGSPLPSIEAQCDPQITPKTGSLISVVPEKAPAPPTSSKQPTTLHTTTYLVTAKPEQSGDLVARLFFAPISPSDYKGSIPYDTARDVFQAMTVRVLGQVIEK